MKFRIGDTVIIECPERSVFHKYDGCVCTVKDTGEDAVGEFVKVDGADDGWWPVKYVRRIRRLEPDEEIDAEDLFNIM